MLDAVSPPRTELPRLPQPRGFWHRIADRLLAWTTGPRPATPPERSVAFTIAVIALGAKMAKADGHVARSEVAAFRKIFVIAPEDIPHAARVFDLAREHVAGYQAWADRIARLFPPGDPTLEDVLEGLVMIAAADGTRHPAEVAFIEDVGRRFAIPEDRVKMLIRRYDPTADCPACELLGIDPETPFPEARAKFKAMIREAHPDHAIGRGLPPEAVRMAEVRTQRLNDAWREYAASHGPD